MVEKPMTERVAEAEETDRPGRRNGCVLDGRPHLRLHGAVRRMKAIVDGGDLGELHYLDAGARQSRALPVATPDVLWDLAPHDLAIVDHTRRESPARRVGHRHGAHGRGGLVDVAT
jgi:predicted dehydrogenase